MKEIWRWVVGYKGYYEISTLGRLRSLDRKQKRYITGRATHFFRRKGRVMRLFRTKRGYLHAQLSINNVYKTGVISRLVAQAFIPNPKNKPQVNHIDGNKLNNKVSNFEWVTNQENCLHAFRTGLHVIPLGDKNWHTKITDAQAKEVRRLSKLMPRFMVARVFGVTPMTIYNVMKKRKRWSRPATKSKT